MEREGLRRRSGGRVAGLESGDTQAVPREERRHPGTLLYGGRHTGRGRLRGRLAGTGTQGRRDRRTGDGDVRRPLHGRDVQAAVAREDGALPRPYGGLLAGRQLPGRRPAALQGGAPGLSGGELRQHHGGREGPDRLRGDERQRQAGDRQLPCRRQDHLRPRPQPGQLHQQRHGARHAAVSSWPTWNAAAPSSTWPT